ncbi:enoyl-[acyl-carrier-protein] reductase FabV, partial [Streptomyces sp. SID11233]|nr:enoyl-[acyl-carrier-protein] reductase FabV [Streptomyces sp. SID11233]
MTERVITPRNRGFLFLDAHPAGCARVVHDMWHTCPEPVPAPPTGEGPVALV